MPKEVVSGFWQAFNMDLRAMSEEWFNADKANAIIIRNALINPAALASS